MKENEMVHFDVKIFVLWLRALKSPMHQRIYCILNDQKDPV